MDDKKESLIEEMRQGRTNYQSVYLKFIGDKNQHHSHVFCFYEGEDGKYYNQRIFSKFSVDNVVTYIVGNKKNILDILKRINSDEIYKDVCTMFFIDRDYDESNLNISENLFETPCYSIENLYSQRECLKKILLSEFSLNPYEKDFQKCIDDFEKREKEFYSIIMEFNSLLYLNNKKSNNCQFSRIETNKIVDIDIESTLKLKNKEKYQEAINKIKEELNAKDEEIQNSIEELIKKGNYSLNFRGKNQLDFFVEFLNKLKCLRKEGKYFETKYDVKLNITNNRLSELSQYAVTPPQLEKFLTEQNLKFQTLCMLRNL
jgi:hypothetical protein